MSPIATFLQYIEDSSLQCSFPPTLLLFLLILFNLIFFKSYQRKKTINLPPSPPNKLTIIGHLHQLGPLPHHHLQTLAQKHDPLMLSYTFVFNSPTLVVSSPQAAKEIMKTHDLIFSIRPNLATDKRFYYDKDLVFVPCGEHWRQARRICILQLLSAKRVQSFRSVREEETKLMIQKITTSCNNSDQVMNLSEMIMTLTNDIICKVSFGMYYGEEVAGKRFGDILGELIYLLGVFNFKDYIPWLG